MTGNPWYRRKSWRSRPSEPVVKQEVGDEKLRRLVDGAIFTASQSPDPRAQVNPWRQTS